MTHTHKRLIAGNWKMNGLFAQLEQLEELAKSVTPAVAAATDVAICVPSTLLAAASQAAYGSELAIGAQDCHAEKSGAYTGDVSAQMLAEAGARYVIVGHSERRAAYAESDSLVSKKAQAALDEGMDPIICLGETLQQRESGQTLAVIGSQLEGSVPDTAEPQRLVVAYEPIWAIGTGLTANVAQIEEVHSAIRAGLVAKFGESGRGIRILYGGSMKAENAPEILAVPNVDGGLVGGASLTNAAFLPIISAAVNADN